MTAAQIAELPMYVAPSAMREASEQWLALTLQLLGVGARERFAGDLYDLWLHPRLLLAQTCGYPLRTRLGEQVQLVGRPRFDLPDAQNGAHCSLLVVRRDDPRQALEQWRGSHVALNSRDSNSGTHLLYDTLEALAPRGQFFARESLSGSHRQSLAWVATGKADLAAIDSVTFAYLPAEETAGVRILGRTGQSPTLPYITRATGTAPEAIRAAMNQALPLFRDTLRITQILPATLTDYLP
ncbi:PhnD/SsuA/transferrin family substrate-binding protein [Pseudomonas sp. App30]